MSEILKSPDQQSASPIADVTDVRSSIAAAGKVEIPDEATRRQRVDSMCELLGSICGVGEKGAPSKMMGAEVLLSNRKKCHISFAFVDATGRKHPAKLILAEDGKHEIRDLSLPCALPLDGRVAIIDVSSAEILQCCVDVPEGDHRGLHVAELNEKIRSEIWTMVQEVISLLARNECDGLKYS